MHQASKRERIPENDRRESILSHSAIPMLPQLKSAEPEHTEQIPSFQFMDTSPTAQTKSLMKSNTFAETTPSMAALNGDLDLRYQKSTASSNGGLLIRDNEGNHSLDKITSSLNMIGEAVSLNDLELQKSSERKYSFRKISFHSNNVNFPDQGSFEEIGEAVCLSAGNRRLLSDISTPPKQTKGKPKGYKFFKDEEGHRAYNVESGRFRENKSELITIQEDENSPNLRRQTHGHQNSQQKKEQWTNRETPGSNRNRSHNNRQEAAITIFSDGMSSPVSALSPVPSNRLLADDATGLAADRPVVNSWERVILSEDAQLALEAKLSLKRNLSIFFAIGVFSFVLYLAANGNTSYQNLFVVCFLYCIYYGIEDIIRSCSLQRESWRQTEDIYSTIDALSALIFLLLTKLKIAKVISVSMISFIPFMATAWAHYALSKAPGQAKRQRIFIRCFYTLQVFMITGKLDKVFDWDWRIIFGPCWICFGIIGFHSVLSIIKETSKLLKNVLTSRRRENVALEFIGLSWSLFYYTQYIVVFTAMLGCSQAFLVVDKSLDLLKLTTFVSLCLNAFLILYTLLAFQPLTQFLKKQQRIPEPIVHLESPQVLKKQVTINLEVVKNKSYFVMLSSTYFLPLKNGFTAKKDENIKRIKKMINNFKSWKPKKPLSRSPTPAKIEDLIQDKDVLDEKFSKIASGNKKESAFVKISRAAKAKSPTTICFENVTGIFSRERESTIINTETHRKQQNLSADDLQFNKLVTLKSEKNGKISSEENLCYLCFENHPNAVLMGCGHGGICYECASALVKKKNECMECRSSVDAIYKVDANIKLCDIVKGVEISKVCVSP